MSRVIVPTDTYMEYLPKPFRSLANTQTLSTMRSILEASATTRFVLCREYWRWISDALYPDERFVTQDGAIMLFGARWYERNE